MCSLINHIISNNDTSDRRCKDAIIRSEGERCYPTFKRILLVGKNNGSINMFDLGAIDFQMFVFLQSWKIQYSNQIPVIPTLLVVGKACFWAYHLGLWGGGKRKSEKSFDLSSVLRFMVEKCCYYSWQQQVACYTGKHLGSVFLERFG